MLVCNVGACGNDPVGDVWRGGGVQERDGVRAVRLMQLLQWEPKSPAYLRTTLGIASREYFTKAYLRPLAEAGLIARSDPGHPNSPQQKYALTKDGRRRIERVAPL